MANLQTVQSGSAAQDLGFGSDYREPVVLKDGRAAQLFTLRAEHAPAIAQGFAKLSKRSRYFRFFAAKRELSADELQRLIALDGFNQFAIAAAVETLAGWEGAAVARLVRVDDAPDCAEFAITVLDDYQGLGLGRLLLERLLAAAAERGYRCLRGEVLAENRAMLGLLRAAVPRLVVHTHGLIVDVEIPLGPPTLH